MPSPFNAIKGRTGLLARNGKPVRGHGPNITAPAIVSSGQPFDLTRLLTYPLTNNQFDNFLVARDWPATLNGSDWRKSGVRIQPTWQKILQGAYPGWEPAFQSVNRIRRKGTTNGDQRVLVLEMQDFNPNQIRVGDQCWFFNAVSGGDNTIQIAPGFNLNLKTKYTITASHPSPMVSPYTQPCSHEITLSADLPAIDFSPGHYAPYDWGGDESVLTFVHHSFYADASTKRLRSPLGAHASIAKDQVLKNGGSMVIGGLQRIPTWMCWTTLANLLDAHTLIWELYQMEQQGLAETYGDTDTRYLVNEAENEPVYALTDAEAHADTGLPRPQNAIGLRTALIEHMVPIMRAAWGPDRTHIIKGGGFGGIDEMRKFDIDMLATFGPTFRCVLGVHNYSDYAAPHKPTNNNQYDFTNRADADLYATEVKAKANTLRFTNGGAIMTEYGAPNHLDSATRGRLLGVMQTALSAQGIPVCLWDLVGDNFGCDWIYTDVPGIIGTPVQALNQDLRAYAGKAGRST